MNTIPTQYQCWWGFKSLPEINEYEPGWQHFVITDEDSVIRHWLKAGAKGYRLDVADELPDDVLAMIYTVARQTQPEAVMIGEVWEDATTKYSYGVKRRYALGGMLDSVTNYPLRSRCDRFFEGYVRRLRPEILFGGSGGELPWSQCTTR